MAPAHCELLLARKTHLTYFYMDLWKEQNQTQALLKNEGFFWFYFGYYFCSPPQKGTFNAGMLAINGFYHCTFKLYCKCTLLTYKYCHNILTTTFAPNDTNGQFEKLRNVIG